MKYSTIFFSLFVGALAMPQEASTTTSASASVFSDNLTPQQRCAIACDPADTDCRAACLGVAHPNPSQVVETNQCAANCDQGNGSPEESKKFSDCVQSCINNFFPSSQTAGVGASAPVGHAASATGSIGAVASSVASRIASGTGSSTASDAAATSSPTGAANSNTVQLAGVGVAGLFMAIFAL